MAESPKEKIQRLREAGLVIPDDLSEADVQRLASLTAEEITELAKLFVKVYGPKGPHFRVHPGRPPGQVQK